MPSIEAARAIFGLLEEGFGPSFFAHVSDDVSWTVTGIDNTFSGPYLSKAAIAAAFKRVEAVMAEPQKPKVQNVILDASGQSSVVEFTTILKPKNGGQFPLDCWVCQFEGETIVQIRDYHDSALMNRVMDPTGLLNL